LYGGGGTFLRRGGRVGDEKKKMKPARPWEEREREGKPSILLKWDTWSNQAKRTPLWPRGRTGASAGRIQDKKRSLASSGTPGSGTERVRISLTHSGAA